MPHHNSFFTDGATVGWSYETGFSASDLITVDVVTGTALACRKQR